MMWQILMGGGGAHHTHKLIFDLSEMKYCWVWESVVGERRKISIFTNAVYIIHIFLRKKY